LLNEPLQCVIEISSNARRRLFLALKQHHRCQRPAFLLGNLLQTWLIVANGIPQNAFHSITSWSASARTSYRDTNLKQVGKIGFHEPINDSNYAAPHGMTGWVTRLEQGLNEPPVLETTRNREVQRRISRSRGRTSLSHQVAYFPLFVSLTVRFFLPFARRRARRRRPFLVAIRERNPCLLARLRRLG